MSERHKDSDSKSEPEPAFGMRVTGVHQGALDRQISEAVSINNTPPSELMNSKMSLDIIQCGDCSSLLTYNHPA